MDRRYLTTIAVNYGGGPVGVETLAAALSEPRDAIEDIIEPYLIQCGFLQRTPRGRLITGHAFRHLGLPEPRARSGAVRVVRGRRGSLTAIDASHFKSRRVKGLAKIVTLVTLPVDSETTISTFTEHRLVLRVAAVPALGAAKSLDIGKRTGGRIVEPHELRIGRLECRL